MNLHRASLSRLQARPVTRIALPVVFAVLVVGAYVAADSSGYQRGRQYAAIAEAKAGDARAAETKNLARLIAAPIEVAMPMAVKGDQLTIPQLLRAIEPEAVYRPAPRVAAAAKPHAPAVPAFEAKLAEMPKGVERFDQCGSGCETRDPMLVPASYAVVGAAPAATARTSGDEGSFFSLPSLPSPGAVVDRTVDGTVAAYHTVKGVVSGAVSSAIDFVR